jgi:hypothetical protein
MLVKNIVWPSTSVEIFFPVWHPARSQQLPYLTLVSTLFHCSVNFHGEACWTKIPLTHGMPHLTHLGRVWIWTGEECHDPNQPWHLGQNSAADRNRVPRFGRTYRQEIELQISCATLGRSNIGSKPNAPLFNGQRTKFRLAFFPRRD